MKLCQNVYQTDGSVVQNSGFVKLAVIILKRIKFLLVQFKIKWGFLINLSF